MDFLEDEDKRINRLHYYIQDTILRLFVSARGAAAAKAAAVVRLGGILIHATWGSRTQ
jgi:hypothetical protein